MGLFDKLLLLIMDLTGILGGLFILGAGLARNFLIYTFGYCC